MLIFLCLGTDDLYAQNTYTPNAPTWRLVSSDKSSTWSYEWDGGYQRDLWDYHYGSISSSQADSAIVKLWYEIGNPNTIQVYRYSYTDFPTYYEKLTVMRHRPDNPGNGFRELERFDYAHRSLLYVKTNGPDPDGEELLRDVYSYDTAGNLLQKIEYRFKTFQGYGPRNVIRYSYSPDAKILTQNNYTVINGDLENLELSYNDQRFYDSEGLWVALVSKNSATTFRKDLYDYNLDGLDSKARSYSSSDSLNWVLSESRETSYVLSFGENKPFRKDYYWHSSSDSSSVRDSSYRLFSYLDFNRDIYKMTYNSNGILAISVHYIYNEDMKLLLQHSHRDYGGNQGSNSDEVYVWETVVANDDLVQEVPGLSLSVYPNPFRAASKVRYSLMEPGTIKLELYNLRGQKVKTLISEGKAAGEHEMDMDLTDLNLASGVYILRASSNGASTGQKLMLLK